MGGTGSTGGRGIKDRCIEVIGWKNRGKEITWKTVAEGEKNIEIQLQEIDGVWTGMFWFRKGTGLGSCERGDETLGSRN